ncbi:MAG: hypothetical protein JO344_03825, partial [Planctomycetaceae bacterium]|nr:hypothetical protein [Planctomycetaceae bacterium]
MMTPTRIVRLIGIAGLVGWMGLAGWVARTSQAQNGGRNPPASPPAPTKPDGRTESAPDAKVPSSVAPAPPPAASDSAASRAADPSLSLDPPPPLPVAGDGPGGKRAETPSSTLGPTASDAVPQSLPDSQPAPSSDDPEQLAQSFVERNQKEAVE